MLDMNVLQERNQQRKERWHGEAEWTAADWSNAMCGEAGEAANVVKKIRRHETNLGEISLNTPPLDELHDKLADEIADVIIYADLLATHFGIDTANAVRAKFNRVSEAQGFPERL